MLYRPRREANSVYGTYDLANDIEPIMRLAFSAYLSLLYGLCGFKL